MRGAICNFIDRATPFKACCEADDGVAAVGFTTFDEEFCRSLLATTAFDMILSKHEGLAKLAEAINALLSALTPPNS